MYFKKSHQFGASSSLVALIIVKNELYCYNDSKIENLIQTGASVPVFVFRREMLFSASQTTS
jgi:hypothetical protein